MEDLKGLGEKNVKRLNSKKSRVVRCGGLFGGKLLHADDGWQRAVSLDCGRDAVEQGKRGQARMALG